MSGHSKWATHKRGKAINDSKRSQIFTKLTRAITIAARDGGGDPDANPKLRLALEKAHDASMPKENIQKAIDKGTGRAEGSSYEEITYEGYGPMGVAFMVTTVTDNRNRTVSELRNIFSRHGGSLGSAGSTAYIFNPDPANPSFYIDIEEQGVADSLNNLYDALDDQEDVQDIHTNFRVPESEGE
ncbi:MAG TPA: YebC/PmpR family DNA-binding transcriptional regulator [Candidatus Saccharimonadales bacterium]|nr:YebC/PmpR family DNA-binding transcriptional regulator [Candidatus Saccharimonadales bacterium]